MIRLRSRKGVSGAISAMFVIAIFFIILISLFVYTGLLNSYNQTVTDRNRMDWERDSESIFFVAAEVKSGVLNLNFSNDGGVTLHLVQVWLSKFPNGSYSESKNQSQYWTSRYVSSGQTVNNFGSTADFKRINIGSIGVPIPLSGLSGTYYKIKLVTEKGNVFECQVPYPPSQGGGGYMGISHIGWLVITFNIGSLLYTSTAPSHQNPVQAWEIRADTTEIVWMVNITNVGQYDVKLYRDCELLITRVRGGSTLGDAIWFIVQPPNTSQGGGRGDLVAPWLTVHNDNVAGYADLSQTIRAGDKGWVAFGTDTEGEGTHPPAHPVGLPSASTAGDEYIIYLIMYYQYLNPNAPGGMERFSQVIPFAAFHVTAT